MLWAVPTMATCVVLAVVLPLILGGSGRTTVSLTQSTTVHHGPPRHVSVHQEGVLSDADVPASLGLSPSTRAVGLAEGAFGQVPQGCGKPLTNAFVSPGSASWVFSPAQLPNGPIIISTAVICPSPQIASEALADYNLVAGMWMVAAEYYQTEGTGVSPPSSWGAIPSSHLPALGQSSQLFSYSTGGMSELAVWWIHGMNVDQLILIGPATSPEISRATLVSLAVKMDES